MSSLGSRALRGDAAAGQGDSSRDRNHFASRPAALLRQIHAAELTTRQLSEHTIEQCQCSARARQRGADRRDGPRLRPCCGTARRASLRCRLSGPGDALVAPKGKRAGHACERRRPPRKAPYSHFPSVGLPCVALPLWGWTSLTVYMSCPKSWEAAKSEKCRPRGSPRRSKAVRAPRLHRVVHRRAAPLRRLRGRLSVPLDFADHARRHRELP